MNKNQDKIRTLVFISFYVALAIALEYSSKLIPFEMPNGGKLELHVIALLMASFHLGWKDGIVVSVITFITETVLGLNSYFMTPVQVFLDYLLPLLACGIASAFPKIGKNGIYSGIVFSMLLKYASHVLVGAYVWFDAETETAGSIGAWIFSLNYNFFYCFFTALAAILVVPPLIRAIAHQKSLQFKGIK